MTLEVVKLIEDLTSYVKKKDLLKKIQLEKSQSQLLKSLPKVRQYSAKVKTEDSSNTLTPTLSETAQRQSSSVVSNRSTALITNKFSVASLTKPAILNNANVALVDAVHHSVVKQFPIFRLITKESQQKLEENYFKIIDALTMTLIKDDDDLLGTVNSHIKLRRLRAVMLLCQTTKPLGDSNKVTFQPNEPPEQPSPPKKRGRHSKLIPDGPPLKRHKTEAADSRHAKASRGRTKKDKDSEDSDTSSDVPRPRRRDRAAARAQSAERKRLGKEAQLKKTRDEEKLAKAKKEKEEKEAQERKTQLDSPLDSDDYRSDSSSDINPEDNSEDEEAMTAKDLAREQKERLKALLNAKTRDSLSARVRTAIEHCTLEEIFANAIGIGKTRAITEVQNARAEGNAIEHNAVNNNDKPCPTKGERTFHCACERSPSFNAEPRQAATIITTLQFCFFSNSPPENISRPTKEEAIEMQINTTNAISKALAAANKLVAPQSYVLGGVDYQETFVIVCSFRKVDKHVFRAYNTISVTAQRTIIRKGSPHIEKRAILLPSPRNIIANIKHNASKHESSHKYKELISQGAAVAQRFIDILEKEGLNESEASRRVIFNRFKMQAIASYPALATLKAAQFKTYSSRKVKRFTSNSVKDLFTNLSKDYFLSIAAEDAAKAANTPPPPKEVRAKILIGSYKPIVQAIIVASIAFAEAITLTEATHVVIIEPQDRQNTQNQFMFRVYQLSQLAEMYISIVYFNPDSELELKVLGKQDVKTTSRDKLQSRGSTVTDQRID
ncbi:hypothetical protein HBI07_231890 [Parastagonospora nodorum]|nr:hypothetical protein HBI07_231890 [Parastagonospora nodorum]